MNGFVDFLDLFGCLGWRILCIIFSLCCFCCCSVHLIFIYKLCDNNFFACNVALVLYQRLRLAAPIDSFLVIVSWLNIVGKDPGNNSRIFLPRKFSGNNSYLRLRSKQSSLKCKWQIRKSLSFGGRFVLLQKCFYFNANILSKGNL